MISVITPVLNGERFIADCIKVVIQQSCYNLEHIIVDGQSQDRTVEIIKSYASKHTHLRWISEKDAGQSDALNKGIAMAKGSILALLNVDDYYEPNILPRVAQMFNKFPNPALLVGNCNVWDHDGNLLYVNKPSKLKLDELLLGWHVNQHPVNPIAYFYHKSIHDIIGPYRHDVQIGQDLPFVLSAVQVAYVKYVNELFGNWRKVEGTLTLSDQRSGFAKQRKEGIMKEYFAELSFFKRFYIQAKRRFYQRKNIGRRVVKKLQK